MKHLWNKAVIAVLSGVLFCTPAANPAFGGETIPAQYEQSDPDPAENDPLYYGRNAGEENPDDSDAPLVGSSAEDRLVHDDRFQTGYVLHYGIDVSRYDKDINWNRVKASGKEFAIIRMGYRASGNGTIYTDPRGEDNLKGAIAAGLKVGVYIFSQALNESEAKEEADWLLDSVQEYEDDITIPYVMDYEYVGNNTGRLYRAGLSKAEASENVNAFVSEIEAAGKTAMLYANTNFLKEQLNTDLIDESCGYWVARYNTYTGYSGPYTYWQYSETGTVDGISTDCDLDVWYESTEDSDHSESDGERENAMYRLYNPNSGEHFYTASAGERNALAKMGWKKEGVAWINPESGIPVYRLYNPNAGDHHYTTSAFECSYLEQAGWINEGVRWYAAEEGTPVYRLYNPNARAAGAHHYTTSAGERDALVKLGWNYEKIGWYAV